MMKNAGEHLTEQAFEGALRKLTQGRPIKIWLAKSVGTRLDTIFSVGTEQGEKIRNFDHMGGFYLLGEGVSPDLLQPIHALFTQYCASHRTVLRTQVPHPINMHYRDEWFTAKRERNRLVLHLPFSVATDGK